MTQDPSIDRMEGILERVVAEQSEFRQDLREMRIEIRSRSNTLLVVNLALWATTIGAITGLLIKGSGLPQGFQRYLGPMGWPPRPGASVA